jgi:small-conductance mechanosensitive channel
LGFAVGAGISWLNYRWLTRIVNALGRGGRHPARGRVAVLAGLRYLILGLGAYVILRFSKISVAAALAGLFVPAGAVMLEMLYQLVYARD